MAAPNAWVVVDVDGSCPTPPAAGFRFSAPSPSGNPVTMLSSAAYGPAAPPPPPTTLPRTDLSLRQHCWYLRAVGLLRCWVAARPGGPARLAEHREVGMRRLSSRNRTEDTSDSLATDPPTNRREPVIEPGREGGAWRLLEKSAASEGRRLSLSRHLNHSKNHSRKRTRR